MLSFRLNIVVLPFVTVFVIIFLTVSEVTVNFRVVLEVGVIIEVRAVLAFTDVERFGLSDLKVELALVPGFRLVLEFRFMLILETSVDLEVIVVEIVPKMGTNRRNRLMTDDSLSIIFFCFKIII